MRILQIVQDFPPNNKAGVEIYTYNLCRELAKKHEIFIFHRINDARFEEYKVNFKVYEGLNIFTINNTFKYCYSFEGFYRNDVIDREFGKILDSVKPDVVHIQHLIFLSVSLIQEIKKRDIPVVFTLHDYWLLCPQWHFLRKDLTICNANNELECVHCLNYQLKIRKKAKGFYNLARKVIPRFLIPFLQNIYIFVTKSSFSLPKAVNEIKKRREIIRNLLDRVDIFIAPSRFIKNKFIDFGIVPEEKITFSRYGINTEVFRKFKKRKDFKIVRFGFIGTILPAKGLHILVKAFNKINPDRASLKIYGKLYPYRGFEFYPSYVKRLAKNRSVQFMDSFNNGDIAEIFKEIDILIIPSIWYENSPLTIQEAFLFNTPVVASRVGGIPELVIDEEDGLLFEAGDIDELTRKIQFIIDNPNIIEKLQFNIKNPKSISENAAELEEIYISLTKKLSMIK